MSDTQRSQDTFNAEDAFLVALAFAFLPQNLEVVGPMNGPLSFYECGLSDRDAQRWWG